MTSSGDILLFALCALAGDRPAQQPSACFALKTEILEALEDGPLVVKVTLSYDGNHSVDILHDLLFEHDARVTPPPGWERRPVPSALFGPRWSCITLSPGEDHVEIIRLHRQWANIGAGKTSFRVHWPVRINDPRSTDSGPVAADPSATVDVDVPAPTPEGLRVFCKNTLERLRQPDTTDEERQVVVEDILEARRPGMAPVALGLLEDVSHDTALRLLDFLGECPEEIPDLDARLAQLESNPDWAADGCAFHFWSRHHTDVSPAAWQTLAAAKSIWTRSLAYTAFPSRCTKEWKRRLIDDLQDLSRPLPSSPFGGLLAELDSDDFDIREKASARLEHLGERVEVSLRQSLDQPLSAEARRRVTELLARLKDQKQPPECKRALDYLAVHEAPECGELLQVLAEGQPEAWLTLRAKHILEWRKPLAPPNK